MNDVTKNDLRSILWLVVPILILGGLLTVALGHLHSKNERECRERFGSGWQTRGGLYSPRACVDSKGNIKYL